jgi:hypothetical protein
MPSANRRGLHFWGHQNEPSKINLDLVSYVSTIEK